jgi:hypothetical protein
LTVDNSNVTRFEASDLSNVRFFTTAGAPINSWIESGANSSSVATLFWLKLPLSVPGNGSVTILMTFTCAPTFDAQAGEAPQLAPSYAAFDNGANVFNFYDGFANATLAPTWSTSLAAGSSVTTGHGLVIDYASPYQQTGMVQSQSTFGPGTAFDSDVLQIGDVNNVGYIDPTVSPYGGPSGAIIRTACGVTYPDQLNAAGEANGCGSQNGALAAGSSAGIYTSEILSTLSSVHDLNYRTTGTHQPITANPPTYPSAVGFAARGGCCLQGDTKITVQWARVRTEPPNGTMPTGTVLPLLPAVLRGLPQTPAFPAGMLTNECVANACAGAGGYDVGDACPQRGAYSTSWHHHYDIIFGDIQQGGTGVDAGAVAGCLGSDGWNENAVGAGYCVYSTTTNECLNGPGDQAAAGARWGDCRSATTWPCTFYGANQYCVVFVRNGLGPNEQDVNCPPGTDPGPLQPPTIP